MFYFFVDEANLHVFLRIIAHNFGLSVFPLHEGLVFVAGWDWKDALSKKNLISSRNPLILHEFAFLTTSLGLRAPLHDCLVF